MLQKTRESAKGSLSYHLCVEYFSSCFETAADYVYISESNEDWEKLFNTKMIG